jgi:hypothetical protein
VHRGRVTASEPCRPHRRSQAPNGEVEGSPSPTPPNLLPRTLRRLSLYSGYGNSTILRSGDALIVHRSQKPGVVILEYEVHGKKIRTGRPYDNRFISDVTIEDRKIVRWRDYMESLAALRAVVLGEHGTYYGQSVLNRDRRFTSQVIDASVRLTDDHSHSQNGSIPSFERLDDEVQRVST